MVNAIAHIIVVVLFLYGAFFGIYRRDAFMVVSTAGVLIVYVGLGLMARAAKKRYPWLYGTREDKEHDRKAYTLGALLIWCVLTGIFAAMTKAKTINDFYVAGIPALVIVLLMQLFDKLRANRGTVVHADLARTELDRLERLTGMTQGMLPGRNPRLGLSDAEIAQLENRELMNRMVTRKATGSGIGVKLFLFGAALAAVAAIFGALA